MVNNITIGFTDEWITNLNELAPTLAEKQALIKAATKKYYKDIKIDEANVAMIAALKALRKEKEREIGTIRQEIAQTP